MSDKLDDKLREILEDWYPGTQYEEVIPKLKAAFADEGYSTPVDKDGIINFGTEEHPVLIHKDSLPFSPESDGGYIDIPKDLRLTGAEWLARFERELEALTKYPPTIVGPLITVVDQSKAQVLEAAKKAAGIELMEDKG